MSYRLIALLLLGSVLLACGTPEAAPTPTRQTTASYPTPAESAPSPVPATVPPMPTATVSATVMPTPRLIELTPVTTAALTATLVESIPLEAQQMPTTLVGWSPDERYLMYVQGKDVDPKTKMDLGRLWVLDLTTGQPTMINADGVVVGHNSNSVSYDINLPQWDAKCCTIIASFLENGKQVVRRVDLQGVPLEELARPTTPALIHSVEGRLHRIEAGQAVINGKALTTPLISQSAAITATSLVRDGVYTHNNRDVQYVDATTTWMSQGEDSFLRDVYGNEMADIIEIIEMDAAPDGAMVAITVAPRGTRNRNLWVLNRLTNTYIHVDSEDLFGAPRWSPDSTLLAYRYWYWIKVFDLQTGEIVTIPDEYPNTPLWHPTLHRLAVINETNQSIDIFDLEPQSK